MAITNQQIQAGIGNEGSGAPTVHEIFTKINNAKDKPAKIAILKQFDNQAMRQLLKAAFDPKIIIINIIKKLTGKPSFNIFNALNPKFVILGKK